MSQPTVDRWHRQLNLVANWNDYHNRMVASYIIRSNLRLGEGKGNGNKAARRLYLAHTWEISNFKVHNDMSHAYLDLARYRGCCLEFMTRNKHMIDLKYYKAL